MAYISKGPSFGKLYKQNVTANSVTTLFNLTYAVGSTSGVLVVYNGVIQEPDVAYTVINSGTQIQFAFTPVTGSGLYIIFLGDAIVQNIQAGYSVGYIPYVGDGASTAFNLTEIPLVNSSVMVYVEGILQRQGPSSNYQVIGNQVIFSAAPANTFEIDIYLLAKERVSIDTVANDSLLRSKLNPSIRNGLASWSVISANTNAADGTWYMVDTLGAARTLTLPAAPGLGDTFKVMDYAGTFATNNCILAGNGLKIENSLSNYVLNVNSVLKVLIYSGATYGWRVR